MTVSSLRNRAYKGQIKDSPENRNHLLSIHMVLFLINTLMVY